MENNPSLLYQEEYFLDQQKIADVCLKGQTKIQHINVKVTRQEPSDNASASSKANKEKLEAKFKTAISSLYEAFEEAYQFEHPELISDLRNNLVKMAVTQITSLFANSRCRSCYRGRLMDAAWRRRCLEMLLPYLDEVPSDSYRRAEDFKTALVADGPRTDKYRLGLSTEDQRLYASLRAAEQQSFDEELSALANTNSLIRKSRRGESQKDSPPALEINLGHAAFQKIRQLRRQNLLPIAQMLLHRYYDRHENLLVRFGNLKVKN